MRYTIKNKKSKILRDSKENLVYLVLCLVLLLAPVMAMVLHTANHESPTFDWTEVVHVWMVCAVFFVPFLLHNYLLAPILIYRHRSRSYFMWVLLLLVVFFAYQRWQRPEHPKRFDAAENVDVVVTQHGDGQMPPRHPRPDRKPNDHRRPPFFFQQLDLVNTIVMMLILGMNLGVKLYFRQDADRKKLLELERKNLEQQLEYLKLQINPHFFMNTLNNIHALVDIDPEKAKKSIVVLSRMMRYLLYEGNNKLIPLEKELTFIRHYMELMRLRYADRVNISVHVPSRVPEGLVPPMVLFTFVENAFKHGVTYQKECFIDVLVESEGDQLHMRCVNSRVEHENNEPGGVGLKNLLQRLNLIYGDQHELVIDATSDTYEANLHIPLVVTFPQPHHLSQYD